jgi:predicted phosphate transport protein (TIGR00153 family)
MLFLRRQQRIQGDLNEYNGQVIACMEVFQEAFHALCAGADRKAMAEFYRRIHEAEGAADDTRRDIEVQMYARALFPESRGDILGLLESMDRVPNHAESAVRMVINQHITIPSEFCSEVTQLVDTTARCAREMVEGADRLFTSFLSATVSVGRVDELESEADQLEEQIIDLIFSGDLDALQKILLRDLVDHIGGVSDRAESVADRIRIIVAKRTV